MTLESIERSLTCSLCHELLEAPVLMPCAYAVCKRHVIEATSGNSFKCKLCKQVHVEPPSGFREDVYLSRMVNSLVDERKKQQQQQQAPSNAKHSRPKSSNVAISASSDATYDASEPSIHRRQLSQHFRKLRGDIEADRDAKRLAMDKAYETLLAELAHHEEELATRLDQQVSAIGEVNANRKRLVKQLDDRSSSAAQATQAGGAGGVAGAGTGGGGGGGGDASSPSSSNAGTLMPVDIEYELNDLEVKLNKLKRNLNTLNDQIKQIIFESKAISDNPKRYGQIIHYQVSIRSEPTESDNDNENYPSIKFLIPLSTGEGNGVIIYF